MESKNKSFDQEPLKEPTQAQKMTAQIAFFLEVAQAGKEAAKELSTTLGVTGKVRKRVINETRTAFTDLYLIRSLGLPEEPFVEKWGIDQAAIYSELVTGKTADLQSKHDALKRNAVNLNTAKRTVIQTRAAQQLRSLTDDQRQKLFEIVGYTKEEGRYIRRKLVRSSVGTGITGVGLSNAAIAAVTAHELADPTIDYGFITDPKTAAALALSYVAHYSSIALSSYTHRRLLEHPTINNCPNVLSTGLYFLVNRLNPDNEKANRRAVTTGNFTPGLTQEIGVLPAALALPFTGIVRNIGGTIFNLGMAGGDALYEVSVNIHDKRKK